MAAHKGTASLRPRCMWGGSSVAAIPVYQSNTVRLESRCTLRLRYVHLVVSIKLPLKCAVVSLYLVVKKRLKCNTGKVCNCLNQFLLTLVLSVEEHVFMNAQKLSECTVCGPSARKWVKCFAVK
jgi:hypothetical protein